MKLKKIKIENYKSIRSLKEDLDGNVFIVKGDNEEGKTTFCRSFLKLVTKVEKPEVPVTLGEARGSIEGLFVDKEGNRFTVILDFTNDKETIRMVSPEGISTSKVGEIRNFFNYTYIDVDEFIAWSSTAEGRRKQRDIVLDLLPEESRARFKREEEKEKHLYESRTMLNRDLLVAKTIHEKNIVSDEDKELAKNVAVLEAQSKLQEEKYLKLLTTDETKQLNDEIDDIQKAYGYASTTHNKFLSDKAAELERIDEDIQSLERQIKEKRHTQEVLEANMKDASKEMSERSAKDEAKLLLLTQKLSSLPKVDLEAEKDESEKLKKSLALANDAIKAMKAAEGSQDTYKQIKQDVEKKDTMLKETRDRKQDIFLSANIPIKGLSVDESGIMLNGLPFSKEQLSTSQIMTTIFNIIVAMNKKTPIFYLGRAESLGKAKLDEILRIANENDYQVFLDRVEPGSLKIELYEELTQRSTQQNLLE